MPPLLAGIAVALFGYFFVAALVKGRIPVARSFLRLHYAARRDSPVIYWFFTFLAGLITLYGLGALAEGLSPGLNLPWVEG